MPSWRTRRIRGIYFTGPEDKELKKTIKNARKKLETPVAPALPCKTSKNSQYGVTRGKFKEIKSKLACILEASESTRLRMGESLPNYHHDHIAGKGKNSLQHYNLVHKFIPVPQAMKIPAAKAAVDKEWEILDKIPRGTWRKSEVKKRWSMKQGRRAQKFILPHWWTSVIWGMPNYRQSTKNIKVELYSEAILLKMILDLVRYSLNKDHQHLKGQQQKSWMSYPDCQGVQDKQLDAVSACTQVKWRMLPNYWKFQSRNVRTFGFVYHDTHGPNHGPVWKIQSFLLSEICTVIFWQDWYGKGNLRKSYWNTVGKRFPIGNAFSYTVKKDYSYLCMWMTSNWLERNIELTRCGKYSIKKLTWENQHLSLIMYT